MNKDGERGGAAGDRDFVWALVLDVLEFGLILVFFYAILYFSPADLVDSTGEPLQAVASTEKP